MIPAPGDTFAGKYQVREVLGQGGSSIVLRAFDVEVHRDVALKILLAEDSGAYPPGVVERFMVEAQVIANLTDASTIRLYDFGKDGPLLYMVFQYLAGTDLDTVIKRGPLAPKTVVHIGVQLLTALGEAHDAGVLHRDLKPANVLMYEHLGDPHRVKLLDFGIAWVDPSDGGQALTATGFVVGTPKYMAPEQFFGAPLSPATDIFGLGLVLFEALVGGHEPRGDKRVVLQWLASDDRLRLPKSVPRGLREVVERMVMQRAEDRFASASAASAALSQALNVTREYSRSSSSSTSSSFSGGSRSNRSTSQSRSREPAGPSPAVVASIVGALLVCAGFAWWFSRDAEPPPPFTAERVLPNDLITSGSVEAVPIEMVHIDKDADLCGEPVDGDWFMLDDGVRRLHTLLPPGYDRAKRYPILLALRPKYLPARVFVQDASLREFAERGMVVTVIEPYGSDFTYGGNSQTPPEVITDALAALEHQLCVDTRRIYILGHHDGAGFARRIACTLDFSAMLLTGWAERPGEGWCEVDVPTMWVIGRDDDMMPYEGGSGCNAGDYLTASDHDDLWRARNQCKRRAKSWPDEDGPCTTWDCDTPYVSCHVAGAHHLARSEHTLFFPLCSRTPLMIDLPAVGGEFFEREGRDI